MHSASSPGCLSNCLYSLTRATVPRNSWLKREPTIVWGRQWPATQWSKPGNTSVLVIEWKMSSFRMAMEQMLKLQGLWASYQNTSLYVIEISCTDGRWKVAKSFVSQHTSCIQRDMTESLQQSISTTGGRWEEDKSNTKIKLKLASQTQGCRRWK